MSPKKPPKPKTVVAAPRIAIRPAVAPAPRPATGPADAPGAEAEALLRDIGARRARIADDFYEIGVALERLSRPRLYRALGFATFDDLLKRRRVMSRMQATKLIAVAQAYPKKVALRLGVEKGYALVRHVAATPAPDVALALARSNASIAGKRVHRMTVNELRDATKQVLGGPPASDAETKAARRSARQLQRTLRSRGAKSAKVRAQREGAKWTLQIVVALDEAGAFE